MAVDRSTAPVVLWTSSPSSGPVWLYPMNFADRGRVLAAFGPSAAGSSVPINHLYTIRLLNDDGSPVASVEPKLWSEAAHQEFFDVFSPDGRAMAYLSDESGVWEIYVTPYPDRGKRCQVSEGGGTDPSWSADGREVTYKWGRTMYSVPITSVAECRVGEPKALFTGAFPRFDGYGHDLSPDSRRFLMLESEALDKPARSINIWTGFFEELRRKAPLPRQVVLRSQAGGTPAPRSWNHGEHKGHGGTTGARASTPAAATPRRAGDGVTARGNEPHRTCRVRFSVGHAVAAGRRRLVKARAGVGLSA